MKPLIHSKISVKSFGGSIQDYQPIHDWFDQTKAFIPDSRHRLLLHNSFGIYLCEQIFGDFIVDNKDKIIKMPYITNSDNIQVSVRDVGEQHVLDDVGEILTLDACFKDLPFSPEIAGGIFSKIKKGNYLLVD